MLREAGEVARKGGYYAVGVNALNAHRPTLAVKLPASRKQVAPLALETREPELFSRIGLSGGTASAAGRGSSARVPEEKTRWAARRQPYCRFHHVMARRRCEETFAACQNVEFLTRYNRSSRWSGNLWRSNAKPLATASSEWSTTGTCGEFHRLPAVGCVKILRSEDS